MSYNPMDPAETIRKIRELLASSPPPEKFWPDFLACCASLCHAKIGVLLVFQSENNRFEPITAWPKKGIFNPTFLDIFTFRSTGVIFFAKHPLIFSASLREKKFYRKDAKDAKKKENSAACKKGLFAKWGKTFPTFAPLR